MTSKKVAHIIAHSHWDREWYLPYEKHHVRLIQLMDTLIDLLDRDPQFHSFHLDGQTIVLEDYLQVRPENKDILKRLVQEGRLVIGPWYILQDEFLTSGEANIRNLQIGHRDAAEYGAVSKIGYFPDSFGNMGQAPQLLRQAGIDVAVFGRGVKPVGFNNELKGDYESAYSELNWESPDGSQVLGILFANWYNNGMEIPVDAAEAQQYWNKRLQDAGAYASTPHLLFMNGCDHQPVQSDLSAALDTARSLFPDIQFVHSDFGQYVRQVQASLPQSLSTVRGELRSQRTDGWWTLVNTASARVYIKQANQHSQALLERTAEPLAAFAALLGNPYPHHLLRFAWKTLMQNHPHDSICGCSVDEVHREMMTRFAKADAITEEIIAESAAVVASSIDNASVFGQLEGAVPFVALNTSGWVRTSAITIELETERIYMKGRKRADIIRELTAKSVTGQVQDAAGRIMPAEIVDLGVRFGYDLPEDRFRQPYMARMVSVTLLAERVPALGYRTYAFVPVSGVSHTASSEKLDLLNASNIEREQQQQEYILENDFLHVSVQENGSYTVTDKISGGVFPGLGVYENIGDIGNEYIFKAPAGDQPLTAEGLRASVVKLPSGSFRESLEIVHEWSLPEGADEQLAREREAFVPFLERTAVRSPQSVPFRVTTRLTLVQGDPQLHVETLVDNQVQDHRLRVLFPTGIESPVHRVDSVFEVAVRDTVPAAEWINPSHCQHQQAFVNVSSPDAGLTIGNLGLNEYEVLRDDQGTIAVTLLRAVGELGDWGVFPTPEAQCLGKHSFKYAVIPHGAGSAREASFALAYQNQSPITVVQAPMQSGPLPVEHTFAEWEGEGLALTAVKVSEHSDDFVLRWYNMTEKEVELSLTVTSPAATLYRSTVLEERSEPLPASGGNAKLGVGSAEIITLGAMFNSDNG
ncbi:alpha-mannosidase [Paenibacillus agri]|uniref:Alpha-mannosidase n=1 Tax=Paenibacillus agri TaxID=2744309 RepID=A0A850ELR9_9BACL|nr:alpha-mannosidase [Paenibacillus agri]NUU60720.1 alpha-mannosidase [Paenibacillus agri]